MSAKPTSSGGDHTVHGALLHPDLHRLEYRLHHVDRDSAARPPPAAKGTSKEHNWFKLMAKLLLDKRRMHTLSYGGVDMGLSDEINQRRAEISSDGYSMSVGELISMYERR